MVKECVENTNYAKIKKLQTDASNFTYHLQLSNKKNTLASNFVFLFELFFRKKQLITSTKYPFLRFCDCNP